ncbi:MAG: plasmid pRiA4b ORF-3 family protein [Dietzia sp.]|uniref:plasmid pRiA4b ORF-3 family protein n=1 Tax=Dietzia sp. TaxID=1871616 RepID=UPI00271A5523|nr:plasmid pRiA4b ORF-3 family protein [Dietzia sp.]MDO8393449.1 plasmid pRiA4b ORF-3 family protein [Dietzia sp.]
MTPSTDRPYGPGDLTADELKHAVLDALASAGVPQTELMASLAAGADYQSPWDRPAVNRRHPRRETPVIYRVKVELQDSSPPIWRRLDLRSDLMLPRLHLILQEAMGWTNSHLHEFVHASSRRDRDAEHFASMDYPDAGEMGELDEADVRLDELAHSVGDRFLYLYDFGDSWWHRVTVEKVLEPDDDDEIPDATVVAGRRACPPEDCGGIWSYNEWIAGGEEFDSDGWGPEVLEFWAGWDAEEFDLEDVQRRVVGIADTPATLREVQRDEAAKLQILLERVGDGVKLTAAGYLPPTMVEQLMADTGWDRKWIGKNNREDLTFPIWQLRDWARALGLVRKYKGELRPTRRGTALKNDHQALTELIARSLPHDRLYGTPLDWF